MQKRFSFTAIATLVTISVFTLIACGYTSTDTGSDKQVDKDLRGTWERTESAFWPEGQTEIREKGKLVLGIDTITISDPVAHLQGFTRGVALEAYTEDSKLFIKDRNEWQNPVSYIRWQSGGSPKDELITLTGGGVADETFKRIGE
jgi:hypothetical protein